MSVNVHTSNLYEKWVCVAYLPPFLFVITRDITSFSTCIYATTRYVRVYLKTMIRREKERAEFKTCAKRYVRNEGKEKKKKAKPVNTSNVSNNLVHTEKNM